MKQSQVLIEDIGWAEGPRWCDGKLYFSDIFGDRTVQTVDERGNREVVVGVPAHPSGLGWTVDGDLLVVSMDDRKLLRLPRGGGDVVVHSELADLTVNINDMIVLPDGSAYIGDIGFHYGQTEPTAGRVVRVDPDGNARIVAEGLVLPNGLVANGDSTALIVAETLAGRLTRFSIGSDGGLGDREIMIAFDDLATSEDPTPFFDLASSMARPVAPDGICIDAKDQVWVGNPFSSTLSCFSQSGEEVDQVELSQGGVAPALGGADGHTLFVATGVPTETFTGRTSKIETCRVDTGLLER